MYEIDLQLGEMLQYKIKYTQHRRHLMVLILAICVSWIIGIYGFCSSYKSIDLLLLVFMVGLSSVPTMTRLIQCSLYLDLITDRLRIVNCILRTRITCVVECETMLVRIQHVYGLIWDAWKEFNCLFSLSVITIIFRIMCDVTTDGYFIYIGVMNECDPKVVIGID